MTDLSSLLSPKSVAIIGAAPEGHGLRSRIMETIRAHPYAGAIYPISRSHREISGVNAYPSIAEVPGPIDLAVLIIPAKFVPEELERCGQAGVKAAVIISSGFAEEPGEAGSNLQGLIRPIAQRYNMIVMGPNSEGFANLDAALCPTFSPAVSASATALLPANLGNGRVAVIAQSGGMGFSFFDRGRPKQIAFNHIVTTGNEACLETFDVVEHLLNEGKTDAFLLLLEDVKTADTFRRVAEMALRAGKPLIVNKIGQSDAGRRAAASHTAALAGSYSAFRAMARHYGLIEGGDVEEMVDLAQGMLTCRDRLPFGSRVAICTASGGGGGWMADACIAAGLQVPELDAPTRKSIDAHLPSYGTSQNPIDGTAQAVHKLGYAGMAELVVELAVHRQRYRRHERTRGAARRRGARHAPAGQAQRHQANPDVELHAAGAGNDHDAGGGWVSAFHQHAQLCANAGGDVVLRGGARALPDSTRGSQRGAATARERRSWSARSGSGAHRSAIQANAGRLRHLPGR